MWFPTLSNSRLEPCSHRAGDFSSGILGRHCRLVPFRVPREAVRIFLRRRFAQFLIGGLLVVLTRVEAIWFALSRLGILCNPRNAA
jgi:hypothetical protein